MIKKVFGILPLLSLILFSVGCEYIKEDKDNCEGGLQLHYYYTHNPHDEDRFHSDVDKLTILVFDGNDNFYESFVVDDPDMLLGDNLIYLPLPAGIWNIVTWGGDMDSYGIGTVASDDMGHTYNHGHVKGETALHQSRLWINNYTELEDGSKLVTDHISELYHAVTSGVETKTGSTAHRDVAMIRNTNTLRIIMSGLQHITTPGLMSTEPDYVFDVTADMQNGRYTHDNSISDDSRRVKYTQSGGIMTGEDELTVDLTVMRLMRDDENSTITVNSPLLEDYGYRNGEITIPIVPKILEMFEADPDKSTTQTELDKQNLFEFRLDFNSEMDLTLTINGWNITDITVIPGE